jgi:hypothetical protein
MFSKKQQQTPIAALDTFKAAIDQAIGDALSAHCSRYAMVDRLESVVADLRRWQAVNANVAGRPKMFDGYGKPIL